MRDEEVKELYEKEFKPLYEKYLSDGENLNLVYKLMDENRKLLKYLSKEEVVNICYAVLDGAERDTKKLNSKLESALNQSKQQ